MTTLHITVDEDLAESARQLAAVQGKTLETWVTDVVAEQIRAKNQRAWVKQFLAATEVPKGDSGGKKWTRDDLYND